MANIAESFGQSAFAKFINSSWGRVLRLIAGIILLVIGFEMRDQAIGIILMIISIFPITAGAFNLCWISALLGGPLSGSKLRSKTPTAP